MEKKTYYIREGVEQNYFKYSEEDIAKANATNISDLARQKGYNVKDSNQRWAEIKGQGGLTIDKMGNRWYCHSTQIGGGPIQLLMYLEGLNWQDSMYELLDGESFYQAYIPTQNIKEPDKSGFTLPEKSSDYRHMFAYLVKTRLIDPAIVKDFVDKSLLYENTKKSCVFVGQDKEGKPRYANVRSTNTIGQAFKGEAALSDKRFGFARVGTNNTLTIMEAPIDLLSYMTIYKIHGLSHLIENDHLLSLGGVGDNALNQYLTDHPEIEKIKLGLDNDQVGNAACNQLYQKYSGKYEVQRISMKSKDFNEVLIKDVADLRVRKELERIRQNENMENEPGEELEPA